MVKVIVLRPGDGESRGRVPAGYRRAFRRLSRNLPGRAFQRTRLGLRRRTKIPLVHTDYYRISMKHSSRTWILLPALIILAVAEAFDTAPTAPAPPVIRRSTRLCL